MLIVLSRHRASDLFDSELAKTVAQTLVRRTGAKVFSVPFLYDIQADSPILDQIRREMEQEHHVVHVLAPLPQRPLEHLVNGLFKPQFAGKNGEKKNAKADKERKISSVSLEDTQDVDAFVQQFCADAVDNQAGTLEWLEGLTAPRWYPVIDKNACTGCLECVNFCLFSVYAIGGDDFPIVAQPNACRNGCPACSRVCPAAAIMFPMHAEADIAGKNAAAEILRRRDRNPSREVGKSERESCSVPDVPPRFLEEPADELEALVDEIDQFEA